MNRDNEMILRVLEAYNKKDDREAFDYVEKVLGFTTVKDNGFAVVNGYKRLKIRFSTYSKKWDSLEFYKEAGYKSKSIDRENFRKADLKKYLETTRNDSYKDIAHEKAYCHYKGYVPSKYKDLISKLKTAKARVKGCDDILERKKDEIERKTEELRRYIEEYTNAVEYWMNEKSERMANVNEIRKEAGLK